MKITNHSGLPAPIVRAVTYSDRDRGYCDYTITELISPPRIVALKRNHADDIEEDASDRIWALFGSAAHEVLRRAAGGDDLAESRFFAGIGNKIVSGQVDYSPITHDIYDYKMTSVWAVKDGVKPEWKAQVNCYAHLMYRNGLPAPSKLEIIALLRDWSKHEAKRSPDYPQQAVIVLPVEMWTPETTEAWIMKRIAVHEAAKAELPECTSEEMWERPEKWAVKKKGAARATKLFDNEMDAMSFQVNNGKPGYYEVEHRPGERVRCASYCAVSQFCSQWTTFDERETSAKPL